MMFNKQDEKMVVVPYRPQQKRLYLAVLILLVLLAWAGGFWFGGKSVKNELSRLELEMATQTKELRYSQEQELQLRESLAKVTVEAQIDAHSLKQLQQEITDLSQVLADKEEENRFYKGLMSPEAIEKGLGVRSIEITPSHQAKRYEFKLVVQQIARQHRLLKGQVRVEILGVSGGKEMRLSWDKISNDISQAAEKLRFKYFQTFHASLVLPENFEPQGVEVVAKAKSGKKQLQAESSMAWPQREN